MNYYEHHIGDYAQATAHLTFVEDAAYSRLIRKYYAEERPLPVDLSAVQRLVGARTREEKSAVKTVLEEFFFLDDDGWHNKRADVEIERYRLKSNKAAASARARWDKPQCESNANAMRTHTERNAHQTPDTIHQTPIKELEPQTKKSKGSRLDQSWELPDDWAIWAKQNRPEINVNQTADGFKDYWLAAPGVKGVKADWFATWRNWVRSQRQQVDTIVLRETPWQKAQRLKTAEFSPRVAARDPAEQARTIESNIDFFTTPKEITNGNTDSSN